ncbi:MAG TPA: carbonic anhydrase family protein [Janthinobacterium sp.]|nr:carbonic anhydrase family protein [Janthinobacterium sp.]
MRNLIALLACSSVMMAASAMDLPADQHTVEPAKTDAAKAGAALAAGKAKIASPPPASRGQTAQAREDDAEVDLSARIAARLAEMRATQAARAAQAAKARKVAAYIAAHPPVVPPPPPAHGTHWSYDGEAGPANWSKINVDWAKCGTGKRQSPIDIRDGMKVDLEQIAFDYHPSSFNVIDNGHTIVVTVGSGNFITIMNRTYELQQFHFHRPSEERINGKGFEMVVHLVHKDSEGHLAVIAVLLERGQAQNVIQTVWNNLPLEKGQLVVPSIVLDPAELLPQRRDYYTYMGSLTTPPCSEDVLWMVMKQPMQASPAQMALFSRLYPLNARPIQASSGRIIKESN